MFRIGDFSRLARVSARLLRWYDEIGVLKPERVEPGSGYRLYSAAQLAQLNRIMVLRELGLSLEQIGGIVNAGLPAQQLRDLLEERKEAAQRSMEAQSQRIRQIEARLKQIDVLGNAQACDVVLGPLPARRLLGVRREVAQFEEAGRLIGGLLGALGSQVPRNALGNFVVLAHAAEFEPERLDLQLGFFVPHTLDVMLDVPGIGQVSTTDLPGHELVASTVRVGSPQDAHLMSEQIAVFVEDCGLHLAGPSREVFLQRPRLDRLEESVIEMQFPVAAHGA